MVVNLKNFDTWVPLLLGVVIPYLVVLLTKLHATGTLKAVVAFLLLALTGLTMYAANTGVSHTWIGALSAFVLAGLGAAASRTVLTEATAFGPNVLAKATEHFGLGKAA